jgi:steroid delta-isomerase-like uncharacterized protein
VIEARAFLQELFARAGSQDLDAVLELWHPEGTLEDVTLNRTAAGKQAVTAYLREFFAALPDLSYTPQVVISEGIHGVVVWRSETRVKRDFFGFPATDRPITLHGCDVFQIQDGLVLHEWSWYGDAWLAARLTEDTRLLQTLMPPA